MTMRRENVSQDRFDSDEELRRVLELCERMERDYADLYLTFLEAGQGQQILQLRRKLGLGRKAFAARYGVPLSNLRSWESDRKKMSRRSFERYIRKLL